MGNQSAEGPAGTDSLKEWTQVLQTVIGFGKKHGHWPTRIVLPEAQHDALSTAFSPEDWAFLNKEVQLRTGAARARAEDDTGDSYIWGESLATRLTFKVDDPEPVWLQLHPQDPATAGQIDPLSAALLRLGYENEGTDATTAVERAVARAGSAAVKSINEMDPPAPPGAFTAELLALLTVPKVRDVMSARAFRRIQKAVMRVHAAEFVGYLAFLAREGVPGFDGASEWAAELAEALRDKPLSRDRLGALTRAIEATQPSDEPVLTEFAELVEWAAALAVDERHLRPSPVGPVTEAEPAVATDAPSSKEPATSEAASGS
jgi:hypothetical protein